MTIPIGIRHIATLSVKAWIPVACEKCARTFAYRTQVRVQGESLARLYANQDDQDRAREQARLQASVVLKAALKTTADPVPCPGCGVYQRAMVARLRRSRVRAGFIAALVFGLVWFFLSFALFVLGIRFRSFGSAAVSLPALIPAILAVGSVPIGCSLALALNPAAHARRHPAVADLCRLIPQEEFKAMNDVGYVLIQD
jgi:hypothetical protein